MIYIQTASLLDAKIVLHFFLIALTVRDCLFNFLQCRYADSFDLRDVVELNAKVENVAQTYSLDSDGEIFGWEITVNGCTRAFDKV